MFTPAQNLEKLNLKFQHEQNEAAVSKLQNQVDFLNKENSKLEKQVEILKGDANGNLALAQHEALKKEIDELLFANSTL
jgi:predicted nuclease with TOPRIM domain